MHKAPVGQALPGQGKAKEKENPAGFLRCLLRKEEYFVARSMGIFSPLEICKLT